MYTDASPCCARASASSFEVKVSFSEDVSGGLRPGGLSVEVTNPMPPWSFMLVDIWDYDDPLRPGTHVLRQKAASHRRLNANHFLEIGSHDLGRQAQRLRTADIER